MSLVLKEILYIWGLQNLSIQNILEKVKGRETFIQRLLEENVKLVKKYAATNANSIPILEHLRSQRDTEKVTKAVDILKEVVKELKT